jgi:predicted lipid-binding transport protein (Tim44 family)
MKRALALLAVVLTLGMAVTLDAEARRLGGGKSAGMQRNSVSAPASTPAGTAGQSMPSQAAPAAATGAAAAAAPRRSWMGPVAGLAAGLGLAALASHFGFGEALSNMLTMALVAMAVLMVVGFVLRKRAQGPALAGAGPGRDDGMARAPQAAGPFGGASPSRGGSLIGSGLAAGGATAAAAGIGNIPADFDVPAFVRNAKAQFLALQSANDARDLERLRDFLTPEMLQAVRAEIAERGEAPQHTEVFGLEAQVLDVAQEDDRYVVSVRFTGSVRDQQGAVPEDLDETWHLTKPRAGFGGWVVAGIQQAA